MEEIILKIKNKELTIKQIFIKDSGKLLIQVGYDYANDIKSIWSMCVRKHKSKNLEFEIDKDKNTRRKYYYSIRFRELFSKQQHWEFIKKLIEQQIYYESHQSKNSIDRLNKIERYFLVNKLNAIAKDFDFSDNFRIGKIGNSPSMRAYRREKQKGCCGFYDEKISFMFKDYVIGFNYGH